MKHPRPTILILSFADWEGLARMPTLLKKAGYEVSVFSHPRAFPALSLSVSHRFYCAWNATLDEYFANLENHLTTHHYDWIIPGDDPILYGLAQRRSTSFAQRILSGIIDIDKLDVVVSKIAFLQACDEVGLRVPPSRICSTKEDLQLAFDTLGLPIVIKEAQGYAGLAVRILDRIEDVLALDLSEPLIAQKFIEGKMLSAATIYNRGTLLAFFSYYRSRTWGSLGPSAAIRYHLFPELPDMLERLGRLAQFSGQAGIDLIESSEDGHLYLLEQNFRPTLTADLGKPAGVDFALALSAQVNRPTDTQVIRTQVPKACKHQDRALFPQDVFRAIDENDRKGLLRWLFFPRYWMWMRWHEPLVLMRNVRSVLSKLRTPSSTP